ncbi:MAG: FkbM family methyltransferase [Chitinophagaceae bacterium]|nr:MAG: FkbM family methyltransferase [Chitinophagaceae bacterium]
MTLALLKRTILNKLALWLCYLKLIPILKELNNDSLVIDCGANVGNITNKFAGTGATVFAFEPDPIAFAVLSSRFAATSNVHLFQKGVWDKNETVTLYHHKNQTKNELAFTVGSSIKSDKINVTATKTSTIEVVDLIEFIQSLNKKITVIKLDVEGAETEILEKIIMTKTYLLFDNLYTETHETKIPGQRQNILELRKKIKEESIKNIHLNWL